MRRVTQVLAVLLFASVIAMGFQNCASYQAISLNDTNQGSACIGSECAISPEGISLSLGNSTLQLPRQTTGVRDCNASNADPSWCIDVAGFCDAGGYPGNRIYVSLRTGPTPVAEYPTAARCDDMGRFQVSVPLPANYNFSQFYEIQVRLEAVDGNGNPVRNPLPIDYASVGLVPAG